MFATNLAAVCRAAGLDVLGLAGWQTRGHGELVGIKTIVCHHTAGPSAAADPADFPSLHTVVQGRPKLAGPLSNLGLGRSGRVYVVAAGKAWHAGQVRDESYANEFSLGIEAENNGTGEPWPKVQLNAYALLCAALCNAYGLSPARVLGHKEVCAPSGRKTDPNIDMDVLRAAVVRDLAKVRAGRDEPRVPVLRRELSVRVPMQHGGDVELVQRKVGARGDGWYGPLTASTVRAFQRRHKLLADGVVGPQTAHALGLRWAG